MVKPNKTNLIKRGRDFLISLVFAIPTAILGMILENIPDVADRMRATEAVPGFPVDAFILFLLATPAQFWLGWKFYISAARGLRHFTANMDLLVALGTSAAYFLSIATILVHAVNPDFEVQLYFDSSVLLITFILFGRLLSNVAKGKTADAITKLLALQADTAVLLQLDEQTGKVLEEREIDVNLVQKGDVLKIVPGEQIPADGEIVFGVTSIDQSMLTGEAVPVAKGVGDEVIGGTINREGTVHMRATRVGAETALARIVQLVEEAQNEKAPIQAVADLISRFFVPAIILLSGLTFALWLILTLTDVVPSDWVPSGSNAFLFACLFGIPVIVIACPCSLALATPTAVMVGTGVGARNGILIKGGVALELAHKVSAVIFDKTGTLTSGHPSVTDFRLFVDTVDELEFFRLIGSAESGSEHPLGKAIHEFSKEKISGAQAEAVDVVKLETPQDFVAEPGKGMSCGIGERKVLIGNRLWMEENDLEVMEEMDRFISPLEEEGQTCVIVAVDGEAVGSVSIADTLKPEAVRVVKKLRKMKIEVWMVTGDNRKTAEAIASQVGITNIFAEVLPSNKATKVKELQGKGHVVAMVVCQRIPSLFHSLSIPG